MFRPFAAVAIALGLTASVNAATLIIEYDADKALSGGASLPDTAPNAPVGNVMTPTAGNNSDASYGAPVYFTSGANNGPGTKDHAYYDFTAFGVLGHSGQGGSALNDGISVDAQGYTMEAYLRISSGVARKDNTGIGFSQGTSNENQFIAFTGGGFTSATQTATTLAGPESFRTNNVDLGGVLPFDRFFHFVKVHDPVSDSVRFYVDGALVLTSNTWSPIAPLVTNVYRDRGENLGNAGTNGRELKGIQYSLTRFYRGALTEDEIGARFAFVVPEPASMMMLAMGSVFIVRRRRA